MEAFTSTTKNNGHFRSISLPTRPHSSTTNLEEHLCRLRSTSTQSTKCNIELSGLKDLYECLDDLLQLPVMHPSDSEDVLGASLRLLDLFNTTKDAFSQMRASIQDLESSLRRRETDLSSKIRSYLICKNKVNKMVSKCFTNVKKLSSNKNHKTSAMVGMLRQVEEVSITIFESLFDCICPASRQNSWSLIAKLTQSKRIYTNEENISEVYKMHMDLEALYKKKSNKEYYISKIQEVQKCLMTLDMSMQQYVEDLDCLFLSLIKTRVSILNVLNN